MSLLARSERRLPLAALVAFSALACKKPSDAPLVVASAAPSAAPVGSAPADRLAPGELVPGKDVVFGLVLPRDFDLDVRLSDSTAASGTARLEDVSNYIRARVGEGRIELGASETRFEEVRVTADPSRVLRIRVTKEPFGRVRVAIADVTPPTLPPEDEETRMKRVGLTKSGKVIDPSHLE